MSRHIKELNIKSFRGIKNLSLKELNNINIITGDNNCGKTSVLEVLESLNSPTNINTWIKLNRGDNLTLYEDIKGLFNVDTQESIEYSIKNSNDKFINIKISNEREELLLTNKEINQIRHTYFKSSENDYLIDDKDLITEEVSKLNLKFEIDKNIISEEELYNFQFRLKNKYKKDKKIIKTIYISPFEHSKARLFLTEVLNNAELYKEMLEILKEFDDGIISINADASEDKYSRQIEYKILSKNHKNAIPLSLYGDGMKKAILLMSAVVTSKDGVLLLDEFETAIHTSAMNKVFSWILKTCMKLNVQLFLTSHSEEAIDKILKCCPELQKKINLYTLYNNLDETVARKLDGKKAIEVKEDLGLELR
ncbi:MAG: ATP/GTP-binding protein [Clostridium sp.]